MINLFEYYHEPTQLLHQTLIQAGYQNFTICMEDDGFLPENVTSPYQFFAANRLYEDDQPKFFNDVDIPPYWEIVGDAHIAKIKNMGQTRGEIIYRPNYKTRIVSHVRWFDQSGRLRSIDHYTDRGFKFAETIYDLAGTTIFKKYVTRDKKEIIYENYVTGDYVLDWQGQTYFFDSKVAFITFYLQQMQLELSDIVINSLSTPFLVLYHMNLNGRGVLFWQEESQGHVPGNMLTLLNQEQSQHFSVMIPNKEEYEKIVAQLSPQQAGHVHEAGYLYPFNKTNQHTKHVLTLTNSDDIPHLKDIVSAHPEWQFHIAARTEMSSKLMAFEQFSHVKLYPTANKDTIAQLYQRCDIYLDINRGNEVENAISRAFHHQQLILAYDETAHHRPLTSPNHIFPVHEYKKLNKILDEIGDDPRAFEQRMSEQCQHAHYIKRDILIHLITKIFQI
ncbi:accessory Sec system glycosylation chaperone GtfB [Staphylococcus cornubiensis]|uniref:accessory Sec system glycosylation chaperone GtfB n=1 Tax=Staphylococcus cornubiensis TaxID=1986155 RepID=UPI000A37CD4A|nr:accessory Sec system glycosylation chaperone GtfB [Staphylococcus cornubiensis]